MAYVIQLYNQDPLFVSPPEFPLCTCLYPPGISKTTVLTQVRPWMSAVSLSASCSSCARSCGCEYCAQYRSNEAIKTTPGARSSQRTRPLAVRWWAGVVGWGGSTALNLVPGAASRRHLVVQGRSKHVSRRKAMSTEISSWMLQSYHATHGSSHALNLFYINSLDQIQQSRGGPNKDVIDSTSTSTTSQYSTVLLVLDLVRTAVLLL